MIPCLRRALACLTILASAALPANAQGLSPDPTGFWYLPGEEGWGASIAQQGSTLFVALFVYDEAAQPRWFVASDVRAVTGSPGPTGSPAFAGTLYRTTGPWFGHRAFDRNSVRVAAVGHLELAYLPGPDAPTVLEVAYTINGSRYTKLMQRQSWGSQLEVAKGRYLGIATFGSPAGTSCPVEAPLPWGDFRVEAGAGPQGADIKWGPGLDGSMPGCVTEGRWIQEGQLARFAGSLRCGSSADAPVVGSLAISRLRVTREGLVGALAFQRGLCEYSGSFAGARMP